MNDSIIRKIFWLATIPLALFFMFSLGYHHGVESQKKQAIEFRESLPRGMMLQNVKWTRSGEVKMYYDMVVDRPVLVGLREDGVVVWKDWEASK